MNSTAWLRIRPVCAITLLIIALAGRELVAAEISTETDTLVEDYLRDGLEILKFGSTVDELERILQRAANNITWDKLSKADNRVSTEYREFTLPLTAFGQVRYFWDFAKERPIFATNPCFSRDTGTITFVFYNNRLIWIHLGAKDGPDCTSHQPFLKRLQTSTMFKFRTASSAELVSCSCNKKIIQELKPCTRKAQLSRPESSRAMNYYQSTENLRT
jgi:hypothetical protein